MNVGVTDLVSLFERSLKGIGEKNVEEIGVVVQVGDDICRIYGLTNVLYGELVEFEGGNRGIVFNLDEDFVTVFLLFSAIPVAEKEVVKRTGGVFMVPVGDALLGRVVDATGTPIDGLGKIDGTVQQPIESKIPGVVERSQINQPLETGIMVVDALVPIGRGQRELIIGDRNTGKSAIALDAILHQKGKDVICIYVAIGQRRAHVARVVHRLAESGSLEYTTVITASAGQTVLNQYLAPYVGCTVAEHFRAQGKDVLIVYDDLSNHAVAYREMSLLMRRSPGREAYPGDIFYLHSRLLERAGKLTSGGSITALPIIQIQGDDVTAYIPTNLISITDGQIFLDVKLFNSGIRPAVDVGMSVSRVGSAAQTQAIKKTTKSLGLELAQYRELLDFSQFGTELDVVAQRRLQRGEKAVELLKQDEAITYSFVDQTLMIFLLQNNFLDEVPLCNVRNFAVHFVDYVKSVYQDIYDKILETKDLDDEVRDKLLGIAKDFGVAFVCPVKKKKK